ncbi:MAG: guanine deaminase [Proteobacteria bacterium]|nr:guanine deaminase [Pseudomonadota bacterium]
MSADSKTPARRAIRGRVLTFLDNPARVGDEASFRYIEDGAVLIEDGLIKAVGEAGELLAGDVARDIEVDDHSGQLVLPGFIDLHIHYPQAGIIASHGAQLMEWLEKYTFPEEEKFSDPAYAAATAEFFFDELLRNGTTTAAVYCTTHETSVEAFFAESERRNMCMIAGKVMMDRGAPDSLLDKAPENGSVAGYDASKRLAERWHGRGRQHYAVTPRFALTSSEAQLEACGSLLSEIPDVYLQTHLAEQRDEVEKARSLFPEARDYTDIYDRAGLLGRRSLFGHGIYLSERERARLHETGSVIAFAPTSNLFIGSGLFDFDKTTAGDNPVRVGLASDVGAGTSYSMLRTAAEAYKVMQLQGQNLTAVQAFYMITLGNARKLGLEGRIGTLEPGSDADIVVLNSAGVPALSHRLRDGGADLAEELFAFLTLGDDRAVGAAYVAGRRQN